MQEVKSNSHSSNFDHAIDLRELFNVLMRGKWIIVNLTAFATIIGFIYSLQLPNIYESKSLLAPVNSSSNISRSLGGYSSFAGLAGINLPSGDNLDNSAKAIRKISSLSFFENHIFVNINLPDLMAVKFWNPKTNELVYDEDIYDINKDIWIKDYSDIKQQMPSAQKSFRVFKNKHLSLIEDKKSGFITLSIKHQSPYVAKQWAELVVNEINSFYRKKDKSESELAVNYLNQQISMTSLSEIQQVLAQLLQEEIKKLTLTEANQFYVFEYINPPAVMEKRIEPNRSLIWILSTLFGGMLSIILVLIRYYFFNKNS